MPKKLRTESIFIAPEISGRIDANGNPNVFDYRTNERLDPFNSMDKIKIYERQVWDWFLNPATTLSKNKRNGFVVMMICLSYLEGAEEYKRGVSSQNRSKEFFKSALNRLYPGKFSDDPELEDFYKEARCGLFHTGMVRGRILINNRFNEAVEFDQDDIKVSPTKFLRDIKNDFSQFINELRTNTESRARFSGRYSNV